MRERMSGTTAGPRVLAATPADVLARSDPDVLTGQERRRRGALRRAADRTAYTAARLLARESAGLLTGRPPASLRLVNRCTLCGSTEHGRPSVAGLPEVHVSLARTRGAVVAVADRCPVGVDVETAAHAGAYGAAMSLALTAAEAARVRSARNPRLEFLRYWVRKESLVKVGRSSLDTLTSTELALPGEGVPDAGPEPGGPAVQVADWLDRRLDAVVAVAFSAPPAGPPAGSA